MVFQSSLTGISRLSSYFLLELLITAKPVKMVVIDGLCVVIFL